MCYNEDCKFEVKSTQFCLVCCNKSFVLKETNDDRGKGEECRRYVCLHACITNSRVCVCVCVCVSLSVCVYTVIQEFAKFVNYGTTLLCSKL
jgi:hypothetical protein